MSRLNRRTVLKSLTQFSRLAMLGCLAKTVTSHSFSRQYPEVSVWDFMTDAQKNDVVSGRTSIDVSGAIQSALNASSKVVFPDGTYLMQSSVKKIGKGISIDFGHARIVNDLPSHGFLFFFGLSSDTPTLTNLHIRGGQFEQADSRTILNRNYIRIAGTKTFSVSDVYMQHVGNGGLYIEAGCEDGTIDNIKIKDRCQYVPCRGIWLDGSTASDFAHQLIDIADITRNSIPAPSSAVKNISIRNCNITLPAYGIYLINTRNCQIERNLIDISGGNARCIALNNYSPGTVVQSNTLIGDRSSTGILCTQYSHDVVIHSNFFHGSFGGGQDIYVAYRSHATIQANHFLTNSSKQILIDMGGSASIRKNQFSRPKGYLKGAQCVRVSTIDEAYEGNGAYGITATVLPGVSFEENTVNQRNCPFLVNSPTASNGNVPGLELIVVRNNRFYDMNTATSEDEYGLRIYANGSSHIVKYAYVDNMVYPEAHAKRNVVRVQGAGALAHELR